MSHRKLVPARLRGFRLTSRTAAACVGAAALVGGARAEPEPGAHAWFRSPVSGATYRIERDAATRTKRLVAPGGARFATTAAILEAESAALTPLERLMPSELRALAADPARATELVDVTFILRNQPAHDAGLAARARANPFLREQLAQQKRILDRIAPLRTLPGGRAPDVAAAMREESALLTDEEKTTLRSVRDEVRRILDVLRREVLAETAAAVEADQAPLAAYVRALPDAIDFGGSVMLNARSARIPASALLEVAERFPDVVRIERVGVTEGQSDVATQTVGVGSWWSAGYAGSSSSRIAILDCGVDGNHPALTNVVAASTVSHTTGSAQATYADSTTSTDDLHGHGTRAAAIACSRDSTYTGSAYGALILNAKAGYLTTTGGATMYTDDGRRGSDWAFNNGATSLSISFSGAGHYNGMGEWPLFFDAAVFSLGIPIVVAARNGGTTGVGFPGDAFNCMTCGNFDDSGTTSHSDDAIASASGIGPTSDGRQKPDFCGPGESITTAEYNWEGSNADFGTSISGTSNVPPLVAGVYTLLQEYGAAAYPAGLNALLLTTADQTSPYGGPNSTWGFGALDCGAAYTYRNSVFEGELTSGGPQFVLLRGGSLASGGRATLVWNRHVTSIGSSTPTTYYGIQDLDLYVYDESDGTELGSATSTVDPTEQAAVSAAVESPIFKVYLASGSFTSSYDTEAFAVAAESTSSTAEVAPPALECSFTSLAAVVAGSASTTVTVEVANSGDVAAFAPSVTLSLPTGFTVVSGSNPQTLSDIAGGDSGSATWVIRSSSGPSGSVSLSADATSASFGETFDAATETVSQMVDVDAPSASVTLAAGAAHTSVRNVTATLQASDSHSSVARMRVRFAGEAWGAWGAYAASLAVTLPAGDGTKTFEAEFEDAVGNQTATVSDTIVLDTVAPTGAILIAAGAEYVSSSTVTVAIDGTDATSGVAEVRLSNDQVDWTGWSPYAASLSWPLETGEGARTVYAEFRDGAGNVSSVVSDTVIVEISPPSGSMVIGGGAAWTNTRDVTITFDATDTVSGVSDMRIGDTSSSLGAWRTYATTATWSLPGNEGPKTVYAQFRDAAGNVSSPTSDTIGLDLRGPIGTVTMSEGASYTTSSSVTFVPAAYDVLNGVTEMRFSNDGTTWTGWTAYASDSVAWDLAPGDGPRTVYVEFKDAAGNVSTASATIGVDTTAPTCSVAILRGAAATNSSSVLLDLTYSDATSGVADVRVSDGGGTWTAWTAVRSSVAWTTGSGDGVHTVYVEFRDRAGNVAAASDAILLDTVAPTGTFVLVGDVAYVLPWQPLAAHTSATDGAGGSGVVEFRSSTDGGTSWSPWSVVLPDGTAAVPGPVPTRDAVVTFHGQFRDVAGNISSATSDSTYLLVETPPGVAKVSAFTGTVGLGEDRDALYLGLVAGDTLTLKVKAKTLMKKADATVAIDLYGPDGAQLVDGRHPAGSKKPGVAKFKAPATGEYLIVVRAAGTAADTGVAYTLTVVNAPAKGVRAPKGEAPFDGDKSPDTTITFDASEGLTLGGTLTGPTTGVPTLLGPDGSSVPVALIAGKKGMQKLVALELTGGTGTYTLQIPASADIKYKLALSAGKRVKADEAAMPAK